MLDEQFGTEMRDVEVVYVQGETRTGKTYHITHSYKKGDVYHAIMGKLHPFDGYSGQDVLLLDEYRASIPLAVALVYLDKYPCTLEARYHDRTAAYTKVFVVSNWRFEEQYVKEQNTKPADYKAWVARFHYIRVYTAYRTYDEYTPADYFKLIKGKRVKPVRSVRPPIITPPPAPRLLLPPHCEDTSSKGDDRNE